MDQISQIITDIEKEKETSWIQTHAKKLHQLRCLKRSPSNSKNSTNLPSPIKNYSQRILTKDEITALENGLNFVLPSLTFDEETFIANIETLFINLMGYSSEKSAYEERDIDEKITDNLTPEQLSIANQLRKFCDTCKQHAKRSILKFKKEIDPIIKTLKNLSKDKSIYITRADKGRAVVILDKVDYINKMENILNQSSTFE